MIKKNRIKLQISHWITFTLEIVRWLANNYLIEQSPGYKKVSFFASLPF